MWEIVGVSARKGMDVLETELTEDEAIRVMKAIKKKEIDYGYYESFMKIKVS